MKKPQVELTTEERSFRFVAFGLILLFATGVMWKNYTLTWEMLALVALALTTVSVSKVSITKEGLTVDTRAFSGSMDAEKPAGDGAAPVLGDLQRFHTLGATPDLAKLLTENPLKDFSEEAQKVLRTLRYYQKLEFKNDATKVWGFSIPQGSPDYPSFMKGVSELFGKGIVRMNPQGLVGLSAQGLQLSDEPGDWGGPMWTDFKRQ